MNEEQLKRACESVKVEPFGCFICSSENIIEVSLNSNYPGTVIKEVNCPDCGITWKEKFKFERLTADGYLSKL